MDVKIIQAALIAKGYDLGPSKADGDWGRLSIAATKKFQADVKLKIDGVPGPDTLKALGLGKGDIANVEPMWLAKARTKMGLSEKRNNAELKAFLKSDGNTLGDPAKLPWCGDFVETCIALTLPEEILPTNPYYAQNWLKFGRALDKGAVGAVMVFHRPGGGHVAFYIDEDDGHFRVLGGNQSDSVSITRIAKSRLSGIRWPSTAPLPIAGKVINTAGGEVSRNEA